MSNLVFYVYADGDDFYLYCQMESYCFLNVSVDPNSHCDFIMNRVNNTIGTKVWENNFERFATKSDLANYIRKYAPNFASWNSNGYGDVQCTIDLTAYNGMGYILNISIGGNANKSYALTFAHAINIYGDDSVMSLLTQSPYLSSFTFENSILTLNISGAYEGYIGIMAI